MYCVQDHKLEVMELIEVYCNYRRSEFYFFDKSQKFISVVVYVMTFPIRMSMADFTPFRDLAQKNQGAMPLTCF